MFARTRTAVICTVAAAIAWSGCSSEKTPSTPGSQSEEPSINLEDEFGGYAATDEQAAFGDPSLESFGELDAAIEDPIAEDPAVLDLENDERASMYAWTILWGDLGTSLSGGDGDGSTVIDWSGSISVNDGAVVLLRTIDFEEGDHAVMPRVDREVLEWVSSTTGGHDGIRVLVYDNPADSNEPADSVTFSTKHYTRSFAVDELADLDLTIDVGESQIHFLSTQVDLAAPIRGFVSGRWSWAEGDSLGLFSGIWVGARGRPAGWVRGHYGENEAGKQVFFGKYIDRAGNFQGLLRGEVVVDRGELSAGVGRFVGHWSDANHELQGEVRGRWNVARNHRGHFEGRWCAGCR